MLSLLVVSYFTFAYTLPVQTGNYRFQDIMIIIMPGRFLFYSFSVKAFTGFMKFNNLTGDFTRNDIFDFFRIT